MSRIMRSDLLCLLGNKRLKVTDKQCGQSVCQRLLKRCVFTVCICAFPHIPQKECDFFLWPRACKRLFVSVWQKQFASWILWTAETMFLLIREWQRKKEREKKRQAVQQMRQRQIYCNYLITVDTIHCQKGKKLLGKLTGNTQICQFAKWAANGLSITVILCTDL